MPQHFGHFGRIWAHGGAKVQDWKGTAVLVVDEVRVRVRVRVRFRVRVRVRARVGVLTISTRWFSLTVEALRVVLLSLRLVPGQGEFTLG